MTLYYCDPDKAEKCSKRACFYDTDSLDPSCIATSHPEWAVTDDEGNPIVLRDSISDRRESER